MTTLRQNKRNSFFKPVRHWWVKKKEGLDENPRKTAIWMAVILTVAFIIFIVRTVIFFNQPTQQSNSIDLYRGIKQNYNDSIAPKQRLISTLDEYILLIEIQDELEKMQENPDKIDTVRVNELYKKLEKYK
jgi:predicted PurR-regulated permease PerM